MITRPVDLKPAARATESVVVGDNRLRLLRDGVVAHAAMLEAIAVAEREILLEMYWVGHDHVGEAFRAALVERASKGIVVRVIYDGFGSLGLPGAFWAPLLLAGGEVREFSPVSPWRRRFRFRRLLFRDHRKNLVIDEVVGFAGGINLGNSWAPLEGMPWRDDAVELLGPAARALRDAFFDVWKQLTGEAPPPTTGQHHPEEDPRVRVLTNEIAGGPNRAIRRTYMLGIRNARTSICITNAYFLPGPLFLHALRKAALRGVHVRVLVPEQSDVLIVKLAMGSLFGRLLESGVEIYAYRGRILHAKTAVFDERTAMVGSHNLDALSWRFNLECNVMVDDAAFAGLVRESFDEDCLDARPITLAEWRERPAATRLLAWFAALFRTLL